MIKIDPVVWFTTRCLDFKPAHFVLAKTSVTTKSTEWIVTNLKGRYALISIIDEFYQKSQVPAFEDPREAVLYELTWS
jgi:hypothetical protein